MDLLPQILVDGLTVGGTYALGAIGVSLIFGVLNVINFGQGAAYTVGAFVAMLALRSLGLGIAAAFVLGVGAACLVGVLVERVAVRPLRDVPLLMPLITTLGFGMVLENGVRFLFGPQTQPFPTPISGEPFLIGEATVSPWELATLVVVVVAIAVLHVWLKTTDHGAAVRAIAEDRRAAALLGINTNRHIALVFCIASGLGGLAGILSAALYNAVNPTMGSASMLKAFAASVLGGMENVLGAIAGGLILGVTEAATSVYLSPSWRDATSLLVLVLVLVLMPTGLLGNRKLDKMERPSLSVMPVPTLPTLRDPVLLACAAILLLLPVLMPDGYWLRVLTMMLVYGTLALSLNIIAGFSGIISLGQAAFYGVGAYASALLSTRLGWPVWAAFLGATVLTGLFGAVFAWPLMRLRGHYVAMGTLGLAGIVWTVMVNWVGLTRGPMGIRAIPAPSLFGAEFGPLAFCYFAIAILLAAALLAVLLLGSAFGRGVRAMRDDELAASAAGLDVRVLKLVTFGASALIAGACGSFWAHYVSYISPDSFTPAESIALLSMVVLGGLGSIPGAVLGGAVLSALPEVLRFAADYRQAVYGVIMMLVVLYRPQGLMGFGAADAPRFLRRRSTPSAEVSP